MRAVLPLMVKQKRVVSLIFHQLERLVVRNPLFLQRIWCLQSRVIALTKYAAVEYAKDNIRINSIAPGMHRTLLGLNRIHSWQKRESGLSIN